MLEERSRNLLEEVKQGVKSIPKYLTIYPINENQVINKVPAQNLYAKGQQTHAVHNLLYRVFKSESKLLRSILEFNGFHLTESHDWNIMWVGTNAKPYLYQGLNEFQKINHFPHSNEVTRKDKLCENIVKMQETHGKDLYNIIPDTYILPDEFADFYNDFKRNKGKWIIKPVASSQGRGIYIVDNLNEVPMDEVVVISRYIDNPYLINGLKFDMRVYVLITSFEPLKIYVYEEGLARFASKKYTSAHATTDKYMHLTNYSIQKKSSNFVQNNDPLKDDEGHKWSLTALCRHFEQIGVDPGFVWSKIYDLIIKSLISIEPHVVEQVRKYSLHRSNCFDLFGFDILLDSNLRPWLVEVNLCPSMNNDSPLDHRIKSNLIADALTLIGIRQFDRKKERINIVKTRIKQRQNMQNASANVLHRTAQTTVGKSKNKEILRETLMEFERRGNFVRIYPAKGTDYYDAFFETIRPINQNLYKYLYTDYQIPKPQTAVAPKSAPRPAHRSEKRMRPKGMQECMKISSLKNSEADRPSTTAGTPQRRNNSGNASRERKSSASPNHSTEYHSTEGSEEQPSKLVITGDDVLMEYIARLMHALRAIKDDLLKATWRRSLERFIVHHVWHTNDIRRSSNNAMWQRLESRLIEMKERRRRLLENIYRKRKLEYDVEKTEEQKEIIIRGFSSVQLEDMLKTSTRNVAQELVSCLVDSHGHGVLTEIINWLAQSAKNKSRESFADQRYNIKKPYNHEDEDEDFQ